MQQFDDYEIQPVFEDKDAGFCEVCKPEDATFYSVYGHITGEGVRAIYDGSKAECETFVNNILATKPVSADALKMLEPKEQESAE